MIAVVSVSGGKDYARKKWALPGPKKGWRGGVPADIVARVLRVFEKGPTENAYLDLCIIKGRFPSRKAQFCTDFLKKRPINEYVNNLVALHGQVESWQGVRADESANGGKLPERGARGGGFG